MGAAVSDAERHEVERLEDTILDLLWALEKARK